MIKYIKTFRKSKYAPIVRGLVYIFFSTMFILNAVNAYIRGSILGITLNLLICLTLISMGFICIFEKKLNNPN